MKIETIKVELTSSEMHDILSSLYHTRYTYQQELREFEGTICDEDDIEKSKSLDSLKCRIDDVQCLENKLMKARNEWLVKPIRDSEIK